MDPDNTAVCVSIFFGLMLRLAVSQFPYSGEGKSPTFGDYEAHRHWMEVTHNLPQKDWYVETPENQLDYWGLDYPPLSAYHSYGVGLLFQRVMPESIEFIKSKGFESDRHKFWMRLSVTLSDVLIPAIVIFYMLSPRSNQGLPKWCFVLLALVAPPFIMIDYAHFQYNCVSLGLTVLAIVCILNEQMVVGGLLFTLAVNHKQMSLYHAIPFFVQMVTSILVKRKDILTAFRVGITILSTLVLLWGPFGDTWPQVLQRVFPLKRGVYEDKVGTFWYVLDRFIPLKSTLPDAELARLCAIVSFMMLLPGIVQLFSQAKNESTTPETNQKGFLLSLFNVSLIFFLFSYHVHEKSIMLPVLPAVLLFPCWPFESLWFVSVASLSLYPLLLEEGSHIALICTTVIFILTAHQLGFLNSAGIVANLLFVGSIMGYIGLIFGLHFITPPKKLPHLFQSGIAIYSFLHYAAFSLYFHFAQFQLNNPAALEESTDKRKKKD